MPTRLAHVSYILSEEQHTTYRGADYAFLTKPFSDPFNWLAIAITLVVILGAIIVGKKSSFIRDRIRFFRGRTRSYLDYIPAILRTCIGIALIGAGSQQALISPAVHDQPGFATVQILLGFLIVSGFLLTPATLGALALAIGALIIHPTLFDNLEIIAILIAILCLGQSKPGIDDLLGLPSYSAPIKVQAYVPLILRLGVGLSLVIMAIGDKLLNPHLFGQVIEAYGLTSVLPFSTGMWVASATIIELVLGLALILGLQTRVMSLVTFLVLSIFFMVFGEEVYAHVTLFGSLFVLLITGSGQLSIDNLYARYRQHN